MDLMGNRSNTSVMISSGSSTTPLDGMTFLLLLLRQTSAIISPTTVQPDGSIFITPTISFESRKHLLLHCSHGHRRRWLRCLKLAGTSQLGNLWALCALDAAASMRTKRCVVIALLGKIWKNRNARVFRDHLLPPDQVAQAADDPNLWAHRETSLEQGTAMRP
jgi:hypothetical protein